MSDKIENNCFIAQGEYGRKFIESIHSEIERIKQAKEEEMRSNTMFSETINIMREACLNKEPALMYLTAEFCCNQKYNIVNYLLCEWSAQSVDLLSAFDELVWMDYNFYHFVDEAEDYELCEMFAEAAECGSPHAQWWCAYCMEYGIYGFKKDLEASRKMIEGIKIPLETLQLTELDFFDKAVDEAVDKVIDTCYTENSELGCGKEPTVDPSCYEMERRTDDLQIFMVYLGLTCGLERKNKKLKHPSYYEYGLDRVALKLLKEKTDWENWCKEHGMTTVGSDN